MPKKVARKKTVKNKQPEIDIKLKNFEGIDKKCREGKLKCSTVHGGHCWIFGSALAMIISYIQNSSILLAIAHGILSWFYVLFKAMQIWGWI